MTTIEIMPGIRLDRYGHDEMMAAARTTIYSNLSAADAAALRQAVYDRASLLVALRTASRAAAAGDLAGASDHLALAMREIDLAADFGPADVSHEPAGESSSDLQQRDAA